MESWTENKQTDSPSRLRGLGGSTADERISSFSRPARPAPRALHSPRKKPCREREHEADGVGIVVAAGKTDDVDVFLTRRDGVGDMLRALHRVDDEHEIADALASVGSQVAGPG